ncbi:sigma-70 family RNA polymerase sigma factor [Mycobacterium parmense]|uniref:DNA-directed RNA polymerase sigma-70 factor n=2 Tax=Mycobacterium parmense TaxID=185642 RepID=A0A7I7YNW6_9MYCO|nr:sigma-70 family RNA polymerase sigma factor [Mycobacterium parmense]MCV7349781.1 sigma-70 family RNA polymerase sigma factor [Mycobacterium parmense]ORW51115.1 RNA polymerase subunit sigma-70 [Mycobacterium parmense]BBZ43565.1 DNA-directed RNA polymerase sigma-70 factor [Mycobacterium parmense]
MVSDEQLGEGFETERPRLQRIAAHILGDADAAQDIVQQAWLRLQATEEPISNLAGWLTTATSRLCLDRLRARAPVPTESIELEARAPDPADDVVLADTVGIALQVVLDRLTPAERVAFVLHDSFGVGFESIASMLDTTSVAARKLASRARAKVRAPVRDDALADWEIVDAFMAAAREGDFSRLLQLLAPDVVVTADEAAIALGTPARLAGADEVARFFNGAAAAAFAVFVGDRPGAAWIHRGQVKVAFDFTVEAGRVRHLRFRAADDVLAGIRRRDRGSARGSAART